MAVSQPNQRGRRGHLGKLCNRNYSTIAQKAWKTMTTQHTDPTSGMGASLWIAYAFVVTMLGTTLPTPLYPIYRAQFGLSGLMITLI